MPRSCPTGRSSSPRPGPTPRPRRATTATTGRRCGSSPRRRRGPPAGRPAGRGRRRGRGPQQRHRRRRASAPSPGPPRSRRTPRSTRPAKRPASAPSCSSRTPSGSGTTTSVPATGACTAGGPWRRRARRRPRTRRRRHRRSTSTRVGFDVTPDGTTVVTGWNTRDGVSDLATQPHGDRHRHRDRRTLCAGDVGYWGVRCSPDGRSAVCMHRNPGRPRPRRHGHLWLVDLATGAGRDLTPDLDLWPNSAEWAPDSLGGLLHRRPGRTGAGLPGRRRLRRGHPALGRRRLLRSVPVARRRDRLRPAEHDGVAPGGRRPRRRRSRSGAPPDTDARRPPARRPGVPAGLTVPGRLEEVTASAADGTPVHSWLALPAGASAERPGAAGGVDPRRAARLVEQRLALAVVPLAAGRAGLRRPAARPGAVDRLRAGLRRAGPGPVGRRALHRPDGGHRRRAKLVPISTRREPRPWAARSAATWPTGSPGTPTGSAAW